MRDVVLNHEAMQGRLTKCPALERAWFCVCWTQKAITEGLELLAGSADRLGPLLVLAQRVHRKRR